jgi:hypothetical protein
LGSSSPHTSHVFSLHVRSPGAYRRTGQCGYLYIWTRPVAPDNYTDEAKSTLLFEIKQYAQDVVVVTRMRRRADRNAEKILRSHVLDSASFLRNKKEDLGDKLADWSKWIGFTFIGFAVGQWIHIRGEKPVASGSLTWFALDVIIAAILMVIGLVLNKP